MKRDPIPFLDLPAQHRRLADEIHAAVDPLFAAGAFVGGDPVSRFEAAFAEAHGFSHAVSVKSGTAALRLGLEALGIGPGDAVVVPAFTFIATATSVIHLGATPVFADIDDATACLHPEAAAEVLSPEVKAVVPVHLYGHPAPMPALLDLARRHGLRVLEDCAQSHLARLNGTVTGAFGDGAAFSFYPTKNLGAAGDGGCFLSGDPELCDRVRDLANHGRAGRYEHARVGWNERLDAIQAAVLGVKLNHLETWNRERRKAAKRYGRLLEGVAPWGEPLRLPREHEGAEPVYHLYVVRHSRRDTIAEALGRHGIATATHYPMTLPRQPAFSGHPQEGMTFPNSEAWANTCLSLPLFPGITAAQQERVAETLAALPA